MNVRQENYWLFLFSASSFSFPHPENCHIIFVFSRLFFPQPWKLSEYNFMLWIKSILILLLITLCVNCRCFIRLPCSVPSFFLWHGFPFCLLSWTASHSMPPQVQNHGLFLPIILSTDQSQARQQLLSQNMQKCMISNGVQSSAGLQAALPPVSGVTQTIPNTVVQNPNMQSIPGVSQNSMGEFNWTRDSLHYVCQFSETNAR
jgi:energy-coupling factor transporter transmembrane protein EcfT